MGFSSFGVLDITRDGSPELVGPTFLMNFSVAFDEDGRSWKQGTFPLITAPSYPAGSIPFLTSAGAGDFNGDGRDDLVAVTNSGALLVLNNNGGHGINGATFAAPTLVDFFGPNYPVNPPFVPFSIPHVRVVDVTGDGRLDIVVAGAPIDIWSGYTHPGFLRVYEGLAGGGFATHVYPLPGNVIDVEWADLDSNGTRDTLVLVTETGSVGAFGYELHHVRFTAGGLQPLTWPQYLSLRVTSLEVGQFSGTPEADYLFTLVGSAGPLSSSLELYEGNGLGALGQWSTPQLTPNPGPFGEAILSARTADFDKDGHLDWAIMRTFANTATPGSQAQHGTSEVQVFMGPNPGWATPVAYSLPGYFLDPWTTLQPRQFLPQSPRPDALGLMDFGRDRSMDLFTSLVVAPSGATTAQTPVVTLKNFTPSNVGEPGLIKVGSPSGGNPNFPARAGFDGAPVVGNQQFAATISNVRGGSALGLVWSPLGIANLFQQYGINVHIAPAEYGYLRVASGSGAGQGLGVYGLPIPNNPSLIGDAGYFQWAYYDGALGVFGGTQATQLIIGQ